MTELHPQYIKDSGVKKLVVLTENEFNTVLEELEELNDIRLYDEAKKNDDGVRYAAENVFESIGANRKES